MGRSLGILVAALFLIGLTGCRGQSVAEPDSPPVELVVSAAASLADALREAESAFEAEQDRIRVSLNFGSSGALQEQIAQGAPVDLMISAGREPIERLAAQGLVEGSAVSTVAGNRLVLVRPAGAGEPADWEGLRPSSAGRVAIGNPAHVPAGQYGKAVLEHLGLWPALQGRLVLGEDVRQVLGYVASGEVTAGIVYATDAGASSEVEVVAPAPAGSHPPVVYQMAVLQESRHPNAAAVFADYLLTGQGRSILTKHGFGVDQ